MWAGSRCVRSPARNGSRPRSLKFVPGPPDEKRVDRKVLPENPLNGGLPEPPAGEAIRVIAAHHDACGVATRVRLPDILSPRAVRRFHCAGCAGLVRGPPGGGDRRSDRGAAAACGAGAGCAPVPIVAPEPPARPEPVAESGPAELSLEQFVQAARTTVPTPMWRRPRSRSKRDPRPPRRSRSSPSRGSTPRSSLRHRRSSPRRPNSRRPRHARPAPQLARGGAPRLRRSARCRSSRSPSS